MTSLRERVLAASLAAREPGRAVPEPPAMSAVGAFVRAADVFGDVLHGLQAGDWGVPVLRDLDVQGLVGHLIGVERDVQRALAGDDGVADVDHVASTEELSRAQAGRAPASTLADWRAAVDATVVQAQPGDERVVALHSMRLSVDALLVVRAFELWTHENDIRRALQLPPSVPDPSVLTLMTRLAVQLLPHVAARAGVRANVRLVLTGEGGGTWDLPMGGAELLLVLDAVEFCRLAANRVRPGELDVHAVGDPRDVLTAVANLALD